MSVSFDHDTPDSEHTAPARIDWKAELTKFRSVSSFSGLEKIIRSFSASERLLLYILTGILTISVTGLVIAISDYASVQVPVSGGTITEGEIGPARFINPVLAISTADKDLTQLMYSGLMRVEADGTLVPDIASGYTISEDGTIYTFTLRQNAVFHDGTPITSADIAYTVALAQNADVHSPRRADWLGVTVVTPNAHTVVFTLQKPYAPFLENAAMGILPKHAWKDTTPSDLSFSTLNTHPIGSGPYSVNTVHTDTTGAATEYDLVPFAKNTLGVPYIKHIRLVFYPNSGAIRDAFAAGDIDAVAGVTPTTLGELKRSDAVVMSTPLPRTFGVFFNAGHNAIFADASVRKALNLAIDSSRKRYLIADVLGGFGEPLNSPVLTTAAPINLTLANALKRASTSTIALDPNAVQTARTALANGGWQFDSARSVWTKGKQTLSFTIATADEPDIIATAKLVAGWWRDIGANVTIQIFSLSDLNTAVIRPRAYDTLLFGEVIGRENDYFAFWHSSQRLDPGLNLALYANAKADKLLATARATTDSGERQKLYGQFAGIIAGDQPAVFLYAPEFIYVTSPKVHGVELGTLSSASERFLNVARWYTDTKKVWSIFTRNETVTR
jgi:peptide/nickel transport system substrate-binding protein